MCGDELELVDYVRALQRQQQRKADQTPAAAGKALPLLALGIGDDMAALSLNAETECIAQESLLLVSCDMLLDGVHFDVRRHPISQIGRKAIACSLSDCAAMAVRPVAATVSVALPSEMSVSAAKEMISGMFEMAGEYGTAIVGGDTTRWPHPLAIDVAIYAVPHPGIDPVARGGACVGDGLFVTGRLGGSMRGRHLTFTPRVSEARALAQALGTRLHAMIDISDGLALDLWRLCQESSVGAIIDMQQLEKLISDDARALSHDDGRSALDHVLEDGEDFELLIAVAADTDVDSLDLSPVGQVTPSGLSIRRDDGSVEALQPRGYVH